MRLAISQLPREPTFRPLGYATLTRDYAAPPLLPLSGTFLIRASAGGGWARAGAGASFGRAVVPRVYRVFAGLLTARLRNRREFAAGATGAAAAPATPVPMGY